MSAKKTEETAAAAVEAPKAKEKVPLFVPRDDSVQNDNGEFISINGKNYVLPRGKTTMVPPEVAYEYHRSEEAAAAFAETQEAKKKQAKQPQ